MASFVPLTSINVAATLVAAAAVAQHCTAATSAAPYDLNKQLDACGELTAMAETLPAKLTGVLIALLQMP